MRKLQKHPAEELRKKKQEPLAEGLQSTVPTDSAGRRLWRKLSDEQIVEHAKKVIKKNGITQRHELEKADNGLYKVLGKRGLLDENEFEEKRRYWKGMGNEEIVEYARTLMKENKITRKQELRKADSGLYSVLGTRGLFDEVGFEEVLRSWRNMSNEELIGFTRRLMKEKNITGRSELERADSGLYQALKQRRLLEDIGFEEKRRTWNAMSNLDVVELARKIMKESGITRKKELERFDLGLYEVLYKRGLLECIKFEEKLRHWKEMDNNEILEYVQWTIEKLGITKRIDLQKIDGSLYNVLRERKLLDQVGFVDKRRRQRSWKELSNDEILAFAREIMRENEISSRSKLGDVDSGLYEILRKRGLLDRTFATSDQQKDDQARDAVIDALEAFAANDNASAEDDVA